MLSNFFPTKVQIIKKYTWLMQYFVSIISWTSVSLFILCSFYTKKKLQQLFSVKWNNALIFVFFTEILFHSNNCTPESIGYSMGITILFILYISRNITFIYLVLLTFLKQFSLLGSMELYFLYIHYTHVP